MGRHDNQHNDTHHNNGQHNDNQHNNKNGSLHNKRLVETIRSSLLLKIIFKYIQALQLFMIVKERMFTKLLKMPGWEAWVERPVGFIKVGGGAQVLKVICYVARWKYKMFH